MPTIAQTTETYQNEDQSWLGSSHGTTAGRSITLNTSLFTAGTHYPNGYFPSGLPLGRVTATGLYGPYGSRTSEVQTIGLGAATAGTVTITFDGETTAAIAYNATTAAVQSALEALSNVSPGDIVATGGPFPGVVTLTFGGRYLGLNVPEITATPTGLTGGTVTITTTTAGGSAVSDGRQTLTGFLLCSTKAPTVTTVNPSGALLIHGVVVEAKLPIAIDAAGRSDLAGRFVFV